MYACACLYINPAARIYGAGVRVYAHYDDCVYVYICICICIYANGYMDMYTYMDVYMHVYFHTSPY
jgi:hypothetical protein